MRTYGKTSLRGAGATAFLALIGLTAALLPIAAHTLIAPGQPPGDLLYLAAAIVAGGAVGFVLRR